jgi:hypothetical protein
MEEVITAMGLLERWTGQAAWRASQDDPALASGNELSEKGRQLLNGDEGAFEGLEVLGEHLEHSKRRVVILKPYKAYQAYRDMLLYYAMVNLLAYFRKDGHASYAQLCSDLSGNRVKEWINMGGQLVQQQDLDEIRMEIGSGKLGNWKAIHLQYDALWEKYSLDKQKHAFAVLSLLSDGIPSGEQWKTYLDSTIRIQQYIADQVYQSRKKDYENPFRKATFRNEAEMKATIGTVDDNSFILQVRRETEDLRKFVEEIRDL